MYFWQLAFVFLVCTYVLPARSHGNSYIFYEVANSYDLTTSLVQIQMIFAKSYVFYELPIRMNLYEWPTPNPAPKPTHHWGLDKSYKIVRVRSYELATS